MTASILAQLVRRYCNVLKAMFLNKILMHEKKQKTKNKKKILCMEKIFATHGIPEKITSDNGPPFHSHEFKEYMQLKGIAHHKVTPLWPQGNGLA